MEQGLLVRYTLHPDGAHLVQVLGDTPCPVLPDAVDGVPFTQVGAYAFGENQSKLCPEGEVHTAAFGPAPAEAQPLAGRLLESVALPAGIEFLQSACFFDCRSLRELTLGPRIRAMGSDIFINCSKLSLLRLRADPAEPTGLKRLLGALQNDMKVEFWQDGAIRAALHYPEFWEELEENAPAHIFNMGIHGQGYRYRQCFSPEAVDYLAYDKAFHPALAEGNHTFLGLLALDRLRWPWALSEGHRQEYLGFLAEEGQLAARALISGEDAETLRFLCGLKVLGETALGGLIQYATAQEKPQALALLMEHQRTAFGRAKKTYSFDF